MASALLTFGTRHSLLWGLGPCRMLSDIPDLHPLEAQSILPVVTIKKVSRHCRTSPAGRRAGRMSLVENCCSAHVETPDSSKDTPFCILTVVELRVKRVTKGNIPLSRVSVTSLVRKEGQSEQSHCTQAPPTKGWEGSSQGEEACPRSPAVSARRSPPVGKTWHEGEGREGQAGTGTPGGERGNRLVSITLCICLRFYDLSISC